MRSSNRIAQAVTGVAFIALVGCASTPTSESTGQYVDDSAITTKVKAALLDDPALKSNEITVQTFKGRVQLSGFVRSRENIEQAVADARAVKGVQAVENDMQLR
jgi:osmotically-inducible protein OsmY